MFTAILQNYDFSIMELVAGFIWIGCIVWLFMKVRDFSSGNQ